MTLAGFAYLVAGVVLGAIGGAAAVALLIADRWGGGHRRRRCPGCWFDLSGTPGLTCPECGREMRRERALFRTRRRWRRAFVVLAVSCAAGVAVAGWPVWTRGQWFDVLPRLVQLQVWDRTEHPEASLRSVMRGVRAQWLKRRAMEMGLRTLVDRGTPTQHAAAARMVLTQEFADWPLTDRARRALLMLLEDPTLGMQPDAVAAVRHRSDADERLIGALGALAQDQACAVRRDATDALSGLGISHASARRRLVALLREAEGWRDAGAAAEAMVRASVLRQDELVDAYMAGSERVRVALVLAAEREMNGYSLGALAPALLDAYLFEDYSELYFAAEVALKHAGAAADPVIGAAVDDAHGETLTRLLALIEARPVNNSIVLRALDRAAFDDLRPEDERQRLGDLAERVRKARDRLGWDREVIDALQKMRP